ncbi:MAG TPA: Hsp20/alpha crystallin family protein [Burkholderiaceae bacterium]|nr:Hsp20/alpha crystallin family protein [Burkholderiaceae bacterium]
MFVLPLTRSIAPSRVATPSLVRAFDRLFDDSFDRYFGGAGDASRVPALDVSETDTHYVIALDVPGVTRDQLKVTVEGRRVGVETIAEAKRDENVDGAAADAKKDAAPRVLYRERSTVRYARTVSLPAEVDQAASQAKFENGVLTLTLAKKVPAGATQIRIA